MGVDVARTGRRRRAGAHQGTGAKPRPSGGGAAHCRSGTWATAARLRRFGGASSHRARASPRDNKYGDRGRRASAHGHGAKSACERLGKSDTGRGGRWASAAAAALARDASRDAYADVRAGLAGEGADGSVRELSLAADARQAAARKRRLARLAGSARKTRAGATARAFAFAAGRQLTALPRRRRGGRARASG